MRGEGVSSQLNTLHPLRHAGVCAQGYTGLINNGSVALSVPINRPHPFFLPLSLSFSPSPSCISPATSPAISLQTRCTFCFPAVFVLRELWGDSPPPGDWQHVLDFSELIRIQRHHWHGCRDVSVSVETHSGGAGSDSHSATITLPFIPSACQTPHLE